MYRIIRKVALNPTVTKITIEAPLIAEKAQPGQFIIIRPFADSERIPLTIAGYDRKAGTVDIIFQIVGDTTIELNALNEGDEAHDFVGPLGRPTETDGLKKVCVVGGGVGCAIALPVAQALHLGEDAESRIKGIVRRVQPVAVLEHHGGGIGLHHVRAGRESRHAGAYGPHGFHIVIESCLHVSVSLFCITNSVSPQSGTSGTAA